MKYFLDHVERLGDVWSGKEDAPNPQLLAAAAVAAADERLDVGARENARSKACMLIFTASFSAENQVLSRAWSIRCE